MSHPIPAFDKRQVRHAFDKAATRYDAYAQLQRLVLQELVRTGREVIPAGARVLDIGCGTGMLAELAADAGLNWQLAGLDIAPGMCRVAGERGMLAACADAEVLPLAEASVEAALSSLVWQWLPNPQTAMREMRRVVKPGGVALVAVVLEGTLHELGEVLRQVDAAPRMSPFHPLAWWQEQLEQAGWQVASAKHWQHCQYYSTAQAVMQSIRGLGASNRHPDRSRGMRGGDFLKRIESVYAAQHRTAAGLPASWEVGVFVCKDKKK